MSGANQGSGSVTHRPAHLMFANPRHPSWLVLVGSVQCQVSARACASSTRYA